MLVPPLRRDRLVSGDDQISTRPGGEIADDRGLDVNRLVHVSKYTPLTGSRELTTEISRRPTAGPFAAVPHSPKRRGSHPTGERAARLKAAFEHAAEPMERGRTTTSMADRTRPAAPGTSNSHFAHRRLPRGRSGARFGSDRVRWARRHGSDANVECRNENRWPGTTGFEDAQAPVLPSHPMRPRGVRTPSNPIVPVTAPGKSKPWRCEQKDPGREPITLPSALDLRPPEVGRL